jgi:hypothetical protein
VSERVQLSIVSWKSAHEERTRKGGMKCHQPGTQLVELSADKNSAWVAVARGNECGKQKNIPQ